MFVGRWADYSVRGSAFFVLEPSELEEARGALRSWTQSMAMRTDFPFSGDNFFSFQIDWVTASARHRKDFSPPDDTTVPTTRKRWRSRDVADVGDDDD